MIRKLQGPIVPQTFNKEIAGPNRTAKLFIRKLQGPIVQQTFNKEIAGPNLTAKRVIRKLQGPIVPQNFNTEIPGPMFQDILDPAAERSSPRGSPLLPQVQRRPLRTTRSKLLQVLPTLNFYSRPIWSDNRPNRGIWGGGSSPRTFFFNSS